MCLKRINIELESHKLTGFVKTVLDEFAFLKDLHFKSVVAEPTYVRFEVNSVFIDIYLGRSSFEIGVAVGLLGANESYSLLELLRIVDKEDANAYRNLVATTPELVKTGVKALREMFVKHSLAEFIKDQKFFDKLHIQKEQWKESFSKTVMARQVRPKAEMAFQQKDYEKVIGLYESIFDELSSVERKKLEYAKKHRLDS